MAAKTPFTHLHTHSHYSLLDGLSKVGELVARAKEYAMPALALTDHGNLYGAIEFYKKCRAVGVKPIIGVEAYVAVRTRFDKEPGVDGRRFHLTLLAKNNHGYKNLIKLVTKANLEGFYYKPRVDKDLLREHREGLIALSGCMAGELPRAILGNGEEKAESVAREYREIFGAENYFVEIMHHPGIERQDELNQKLIALARALDIPIVGTHDSHYLRKDDKKAHATLLAVQTGNDIGESDLFSGDEDFSFISSDEAWEYFVDTPEAVENTKRIADACDIEIEIGAWVFPDLGSAHKRTPDEELRALVRAGLSRRKVEETEEVSARIEYELGIIKDKGYAPYFLVVADLLRFAHENDILTTIRGSIAGSLVTYLAGITNVNPLEYRLPFERFLNPERPSAPDIDMDFADNRRDEVIEYAKQKYGDERVAQIGTFGTMLARGVVRDVARALGHPYDVGDKIARLIPFGSQGFPMTIDRAMELELELAKLYKDDTNVKEVIDLGKKLEGCVRHISVHAAGVVIAPAPLTDFVPTQFDPKGGKVITQYDMHAVEDAGLLKFDFLGIKNLAILADAVKLVRQIRDITIDIENIPLDNIKTFEMLAKGETMGVFQLGGGGMTRYLKELKPSTIHDINAMVALYRPGPMESIPKYIERKHNPRLVSYPDPRLEPILERSYGVLTYQDDVLMVAIELAGYSWLEADKLRKAMGKKIPAVMEAEREKLIAGLVKNGMENKKAEQMWALIEPFAAYGFNKAHAASYGKVAYQTAYMKANFPVEYMTAVLTADSGDVEKVAEGIVECKRMGIDVLPPDINESFGDFTVVGDEAGDKIRFGLYTIKNFGEGIADAIIAERKRAGAFTSLANFLERIHDRNLNKKSLEALIQCGALDGIAEGHDRGIVLANIETLLAFNRESGKTAPTGQESLFSALPETAACVALSLGEAEPATQSEKLAWEKELLGLYVSGHPLDRLRDKLAKRDVDIGRIKKDLREGMLAVAAGLIEEAKPILTKRGQKMMFTRIADLSDSIEVVVFPKIFQEYQTVLEPEKCVAIKGRISHRNGQVSMIAETVKAL